MSHTQNFIASAVLDAEDFCRQAGIAESTFGKRAVNDSTVIERLRNGQVTLRTVERMLAYVRDNRIYPNKRQAQNTGNSIAK